ncbi:wall-associated receptor kinase 2-like [Pyrus ussuriensis x Pyrus communis]|uniref:Wall-associated receptor kinase 2-like n=1 Tax=Pyrus ussuriensis x Pyrus communis TaxID=2448454 RepID=A0A5N5GZS7_9ROSA|nr:wall-associated receptor kinase 2-like [Pyrus ussuriensis x Pyrus communis]
MSKKKLMLSKEQSLLLDETFKKLNTLNPVRFCCFDKGVLVFTDGLISGNGAILVVKQGCFVFQKLKQAFAKQLNLRATPPLKTLRQHPAHLSTSVNRIYFLDFSIENFDDLDFYRPRGFNRLIMDSDEDDADKEKGHYLITNRISAIFSMLEQYLITNRQQTKSAFSFLN